MMSQLRVHGLGLVGIAASVCYGQMEEVDAASGLKKTKPTHNKGIQKNQKQGQAISPNLRGKETLSEYTGKLSERELSELYAFRKVKDHLELNLLRGCWVHWDV